MSLSFKAARNAHTVCAVHASLTGGHSPRTWAAMVLVRGHSYVCSYCLELWPMGRLNNYRCSLGLTYIGPNPNCGVGGRGRGLVSCLMVVDLTLFGQGDTYPCPSLCPFLSLVPLLGLRTFGHSSWVHWTGHGTSCWSCFRNTYVHGHMERGVPCKKKSVSYPVWGYHDFAILLWYGFFEG